MKKIFTFLLMFGITLSTNIINANVLDYEDQFETTKSRKLNLEGGFETGSIRRVVDPVTAFLEGNTQITVHFNINIGNVAILITDLLGNVVYSTSVSGQVGSVSIPLSQLASGNYTIRFSNDHGNMWGDFSI